MDTVFPEWLQGIDDFAEIIKNNASTIFDSLTSQEKE